MRPDLSGRPRQIEGPEGAPVRCLVGGTRAERRGSGWAYASDVLLSPATCAAPLGSSWVFLATDGLITASDAYLGPMRPIGVVRGARGPIPWTPGHIAFLGDGALWTTDGASLTRVPTAAPISHLARLGGDAAAAVFHDGSLAVTRDGGVGWRPVELGDALALGLAPLGAEALVRTTAGSRRLAPDGSLTAAGVGQGALDAASDRRLPSACDTLQEALPEARFEPRRDVASHTLADGSTLRVDDDRAVVHRDAAGEERLRLRGDPRCTLRPWGSAAAIACDGHLLRTRDGVTFDAIDTLAPRQSWWGGAEFLGDGRHLLVRSSCDALDDVGRGGAPTLCVVDADTGARTTPPTPSAEENTTRWNDLWRCGDWLLLSANRAGATGLRQVAVNLLTQQLWPVEVAGLPSDVDPVDALRCTSDLQLAGMVPGAGPGGAPRLAIGSPGHPLALRDLPADALAVTFHDARRGLAFTARRTPLWRTRDGGESWEALALELDGVVPARDLIPPRPFACDEGGCVAGPFEVRGWGELDGAPLRALVAPTEERPPPPTAPLLLSCRPTAPPTRSTWRAGEAPSWSLPGSLAQQGPEGLLDAGRAVTYRWRTADGRDGAATFPPPVDGAWRTAASLALPFGVLLRASGGPGGLTLVSGRTARSLDAELPPHDGFRWPREADAWIVAPTRGGGAVVASRLVDAATFEHRNVLSLAFELDARGALRGRRAFSEPLIGVLEWQGRWGVVTGAPGAPLWHHPLEGARGRAQLPWRHPSRVAPCDDAGEGAVLYASPSTSDGGGVSRLLLRGAGIVEGRVEVALSPRGACIRALAATLEWRASPDDTPAATLALLRARGGGFEGIAESRAARWQVRCEAAP